LFYKDNLRKEIDKDRVVHKKKPLKDRDDDGTHGSGSGEETKEIKASAVDPDRGWFHKGEHKSVFAYSAQTACDKNGWIFEYSIHPGNLHDSQTFHPLYEKLKKYEPQMIVADAGYKTTAIAKLLLDDGIEPLLPYKRPMTKEGFLRNMNTYMTKSMIGKARMRMKVGLTYACLNLKKLTKMLQIRDEKEVICA